MIRAGNELKEANGDGRTEKREKTGAYLSRQVIRALFKS